MHRRYEDDYSNILETCVWICNYGRNVNYLSFNYSTGEISYQQENNDKGFIVIETMETNQKLFEAYTKMLTIPLEQAFAKNFELGLFTNRHSLMNSYFFEIGGHKLVKELKESSPEYFKKVDYV